jgi:hypothetical protein
MSAAITPLSSKGRRLLEAIVNYCRAHQVDHQHPVTYPTYNLYRAIVPNVPAVVLYVGHNLRKKGLDELNEWTMANKSPQSYRWLNVKMVLKLDAMGVSAHHRMYASLNEFVASLQEFDT